MANPLPGESTRNAKGGTTFGPFLESVSSSMRPVEAVIRELAQSDAPILLLGEPGAGKHATAQRIHDMSRRSELVLRCFRCSTLRPEDLGAVQRDDPGASIGTVYLEELADLTEPCQVYLQGTLVSEKAAEKKNTPRLIFGSARNLEADVKAGRLKEELYYQIRGVSLRLPPLRQRREDISLMTAHFLEKYSQAYGCPLPQLSAETRRLFQEYYWPGNFHELESAARILVALGNERLAMGGLRALLQKPVTSATGTKISLKAAARAASHEAERELILEALTRTRWNRRRAAQELQISYKALLYKLKQIAYEGYGAP